MSGSISAENNNINSQNASKNKRLDFLTSLYQNGK